LFVCVTVVSIAVASGVSPQGNVIRRLALATTENANLDTGVGYYALRNDYQDSQAYYGIFLRSPFIDSTALGLTTVGISTDPRLVDTATANRGTALAMTGMVSNSSSRNYIQSSDTSRVTVPATFTDSTTATGGTWGSSATSVTGTSTDALFTCTGSAITFTDSVALPLNRMLNVANGGLDTGFLPYISMAETSIHLRFATHSVGNLARLFIVKNGLVVGDTAMNALTEGRIAQGQFDTGIYKFFVMGWDTTAKQLSFAARSLLVGCTATHTLVAGGTDTMNTGYAPLPTVAVVSNIANPCFLQFCKLSGDPGHNVAADKFMHIDTNTYTGQSGVDTRVGNSIIALLISETEVYGGAQAKLPSNALTLRITKVMPTTQADSLTMRILSHNAGTGMWEELTTTAKDAGGGQVIYTANIVRSGMYAIGLLYRSQAGGASSGCVITSVLGKTPLSNILPALRGVRDAMLENPVGRLFVSGYYGLTAMLLMAAGFGLTIAWKRR